MFNYIIVDDWYSNPDLIRSFAFDQFKKSTKFGESTLDKNGYGLYPGFRAKTNISNLVENRKKIEESLDRKVDPEKWIFANTCNFQEETHLLEFDLSSLSEGNMGMKVRDSDLILNIKDSYSNGCFQYCPSNSTKWIHSDTVNSYAAVVYLNPNTQKDSGTGFYKNKVTDKDREDNPDQILSKEECTNFSNWELVNYVENVYNRCIIFDAKKYHSATKYFGNTLEDSRLTQVFFFDLQNDERS